MLTQAKFISHRVEDDGLYISAISGPGFTPDIEVFVPRDDAEQFDWIDPINGESNREETAPSQNDGLQWEDADIPLSGQTKDGEIVHFTLEGKEAVGTGLGYCVPTESETGIPYYSITHLASGRRFLPRPILTEDLAKRLITEFASLTDWNQSMEELAADKELGQRIRNTYREVEQSYWNALLKEREEAEWD